MVPKGAVPYCHDWIFVVTKRAVILENKFCVFDSKLQPMFTMSPLYPSHLCKSTQSDYFSLKLFLWAEDILSVPTLFKSRQGLWSWPRAAAFLWYGFQSHCFSWQLGWGLFCILTASWAKWSLTRSFFFFVKAIQSPDVGERELWTPHIEVSLLFMWRKCLALAFQWDQRQRVRAGGWVLHLRRLTVSESYQILSKIQYLSAAWKHPKHPWNSNL